MFKQGRRTRHALAMAGVCAVVLGCTAAGASAAPSRIVFERGLHLATIGWDGTGLQAFQWGDTDRDPAWSPDRRTVAFDSNPGRGPVQIVLARADGSHAHDLNHTLNGTRPDWSPDGKHIVFVVFNRSGPGTALVTIWIDGTHRRRITPFADYGQPAWSPKGDQILATRGNAIWRMRHDGGGAQQWKPNATNPAWSEDGRFVAFQRFGEIWVSDGGDGATDPKRVFGDGFDPTWSPSGEDLAFSRKDQGIWITDRDGGGATQVTSSGTNPDW